MQSWTFCVGAAQNNCSYKDGCFMEVSSTFLNLWVQRA